MDKSPWGHRMGLPPTWLNLTCYTVRIAPPAGFVQLRFSPRLPQPIKYFLTLLLLYCFFHHTSNLGANGRSYPTQATSHKTRVQT